MEILCDEDKGNCKDTQRKVICSIGRSGDVQKYTKVFGYSDRENQVFASAGFISSDISQEECTFDGDGLPATKTLPITVQLNSPNNEGSLTIDYQFSHGTTNSEDFLDVNTDRQSLTFKKDDISKTIPYEIQCDNDVESDENFTVVFFPSDEVQGESGYYDLNCRKDEDDRCVVNAMLVNDDFINGIVQFASIDDDYVGCLPSVSGDDEFTCRVTEGGLTNEDINEWELGCEIEEGNVTTSFPVQVLDEEGEALTSHDPITILFEPLNLKDHYEEARPIYQHNITAEGFSCSIPDGYSKADCVFSVIPNQDDNNNRKFRFRISEIVEEKAKIKEDEEEYSNAFEIIIHDDDERGLACEAKSTEQIYYVVQRTYEDDEGKEKTIRRPVKTSVINIPEDTNPVEWYNNNGSEDSTKRVDASTQLQHFTHHDSITFFIAKYLGGSDSQSLDSSTSKKMTHTFREGTYSLWFFFDSYNNNCSDATPSRDSNIWYTSDKAKAAGFHKDYDGLFLRHNTKDKSQTMCSLRYAIYNMPCIEPSDIDGQPSSGGGKCSQIVVADDASESDISVDFTDECLNLPNGKKDPDCPSRWDGWYNWAGAHDGLVIDMDVNLIEMRDPLKMELNPSFVITETNGFDNNQEDGLRYVYRNTDQQVDNENARLYNFKQSISPTPDNAELNMVLGQLYKRGDDTGPYTIDDDKFNVVVEKDGQIQKLYVKLTQAGLNYVQELGETQAEELEPTVSRGDSDTGVIHIDLNNPQFASRCTYMDNPLKGSVPNYDITDTKPCFSEVKACDGANFSPLPDDEIFLDLTGALNCNPPSVSISPRLNIEDSLSCRDEEADTPCVLEAIEDSIGDEIAAFYLQLDDGVNNEFDVQYSISTEMDGVDLRDTINPGDNCEFNNDAGEYICTCHFDLGEHEALCQFGLNNRVIEYNDEINITLSSVDSEIYLITEGAYEEETEIFASVPIILTP